jgi:hypothetical protein
MGFLLTRVNAVSTYLFERACHGIPATAGWINDEPRRGREGTYDREVLFLLDGVGGFQFSPALVRRALRLEGSSLATILFNWQFGIPGEIFSDLMWYRRNRLMGLRLARKMLAFRRVYPGAFIHLLAFSGGAGIALFACEALRRGTAAVAAAPRGGRGALRRPQGGAATSAPIIETLVLACPAMSPDYNLGPSLRAVRRCYALVSHRDRWLLGLGTRIFGTTDRRFVDAAGQVGFRIPVRISLEDLAAYDRLAEIRWDPSLRRQGHRGGHTAWAAIPFLRKHLLPILRGEPLLVVRQGACR